MRLIDADAFIKEAERHTVAISPKDTPHDAVRNMGRKFRELIENAPTADVVEVVRCKDCRFCKNLPNGLCYAWTEPYANERGYKGEAHCVEPDDFCSMGQRKEQT